MKKIFMITEHSKTNESHKSVLNLLQRLDLRSYLKGSNKHIARWFLFCFSYSRLY